MPFSPFLFPVGRNADVMVGVEAGILDSEVNLRLEVPRHVGASSHPWTTYSDFYMTEEYISILFKSLLF